MSNENTTPVEILLKTYPEADRARIAMAFATAKLTPNDPLIALLVALQSRETQAVLSPVALRDVAEQALGRIQAAQNQATNHLELIARRMEVAAGERFNHRVGMTGFTACHPSHTTGRAVFRIRRLNPRFRLLTYPAQA